MIVEGRLADSPGCSVVDVAAKMVDYGCVQALNLDGGTSAIMYYKGEYVTRRSDTASPGGRTLPSAWVYKEARFAGATDQTATKDASAVCSTSFCCKIFFASSFILSSQYRINWRRGFSQRFCSGKRQFFAGILCVCQENWAHFRRKRSAEG